jgi:hypothetical protein
VNTFSLDFIHLLGRARRDDRFAATIMNDLDRVLYIYNLKPEEVSWVKSYKSIEDLQNDSLALQILQFESSPLLNNRPFIIVSAAIFFLGVLGYYLASVFSPDTLMIVGIPSWNQINSAIKYFLAMYSAVSFLFLCIVLSTSIVTINPETRKMLLITTVIFSIVLISLIFSYIPEDGKIIFGRILLICFFITLPASLYALFITNKVKALWDEFANNLAHLDPVRYRSMIPIFRKKFEAIYGPINQNGLKSRFLSGEAAFPVHLAILIIGTGWAMFFFAPGGESHFTGGVVTAFTFGFLGAYFFSLSMLFRRYVQSDLKSTAYTHVSQRILITWVWTYVLSILPWQSMSLDPEIQKPMIAVLAFAVGVFPDIAWQVIRQFTKRILGYALPSFAQQYPLNNINGITIWVEARLLEEDIENTQNLVTTNIIDLMLRTNLPLRRIVDWIDQGILRLHATQRGEQLFDALRDRGITTATALLSTYTAFQRAEKRPTEFFLSREFDSVIGTMVVAIDDGPNMYHLKAWREMQAELNKKLPKGVMERVIEETLPVDEQLEQSKSAPKAIKVQLYDANNRLIDERGLWRPDGSLIDGYSP